MITEAMIEAAHRALDEHHEIRVPPDDVIAAIFTAMIGAVDEEVVARAILRDRSLRHFRIVETPAETWVVMSDYNRSAIEDARAALSAIGGVDG